MPETWDLQNEEEQSDCQSSQVNAIIPLQTLHL